MTSWKASTKLILLLGMTWLLFPPTVHAYHDTGSGSLIVQAMVAVFFAVSLAIKVYWRKIKTFISTLLASGPEAKDP